MGIGPKDNIFSMDAAELEQRLEKCPAIRRAAVKRQISSNPTLLVDIDARIPVAWIDCPELGVHPGDAKYGVLADKEGFIFPCMEQVHLPYIQGRHMPSVTLRPPSSGQLSYGVGIRELEAPMKLIEHQVEKLSRALRHARQTHRKISAINLIPEHNIPVIFDDSYEDIPLAEPIEE